MARVTLTQIDGSHLSGSKSQKGPLRQSKVIPSTPKMRGVTGEKRGVSHIRNSS